MILIIDNYDSFTYNLFQLVSSVQKEKVEVVRNNKISISKIKTLNPSHIILSPGPKTPKEAGICKILVQKLYKDFPILGICLGHQVIAFAFGSEIIKAPIPVHGKTSIIKINTHSILFNNVPEKIISTRYHSLIVAEEKLSTEFDIIARDLEHNIIMAIVHKTYPLFGLQYHPESILSEYGERQIKNFLKTKKPINLLKK